MITGHVTAQLEPRIELQVEDGAGQLYHVEAAIDTDYSGDLTLPPAMIPILALKWLHKRPFMLADGTIIHLDVYSGVVVWDGHARNVDVDVVGQFPLIGTKMLAGPVWIAIVP